MQWIECYVNMPSKIRSKSITQDFNRLSLEDSSNKNLTQVDEVEDRKIKAFSLDSLKSTIQKQFKDLYFTQNSAEQSDRKIHSKNRGIQQDQSQDNKQSLLSFDLMESTPFEAYHIIISVQINLKLEFIKYSSFITKNLQIPVFTLEQINTISRFIALYINPKISIGCLSIDPQSGCLSYQIVNNSLGHLYRRIHKAPNDLVKSIESQIIQIDKTWKFILPNIFNILNITEKRQRAHPFWRTYKQKRSIYDTEEYNLLTEYIKQSNIEHPFMFEQIIKDDPNPQKREIRRIRYNFLSSQEKIFKKNKFDQHNEARNHFASKFTNDFSALISFFVSKDLIEASKRKYEISEEKKLQLSRQLIISNYESKNSIYSKLEINEVRREQTLIRSGFSELKLLHIFGRKCEDEKPTLNLIVSKITQEIRYNNQTQILKIIGNGKSLFITRYYFSDNQQKKQILLEYCPQKSIDAYLHSHKKFISLETKLFFLYEISIGLRYLRDYYVVHNDLKPQNVLLKIVSDKNKNNGTFLLRLIDFGQSCSKRQKAMNSGNKYKRGYTIPYAAPQQTHSQIFSQKSDVFSFGVMLYQIIFDAFPVQILRKGKEIYSKNEEYMKFYAMAPEKCKYYSLPKIMQVVFQLCLKCLHPQPAVRPSIDWVCIILKETLTFAQKVYA